jgi:hypothetical protein
MVISPHSIAGTVVAEQPRLVVAATRLATVARFASTRTGPITCITVPQEFRVSYFIRQLKQQMKYPIHRGVLAWWG